MMGQLIECAKCVPAFAPVDINNVGVNGDWVKMTHYRRCQIVLAQGAWAAGTSAVTLEQATSNGGTPKAISFTFRYTWVMLTSDTPVKTAVVSDTFSLPNTANTVNVIEVDAGDLDVNNGYAWLRVVCATPGGNADLLAGWYYLYDGDICGLPSGLPTAIA